MIPHIASLLPYLRRDRVTHSSGSDLFTKRLKLTRSAVRGFLFQCSRTCAVRHSVQLFVRLREHLQYILRLTCRENLFSRYEERTQSLPHIAYDRNAARGGLKQSS